MVFLLVNPETWSWANTWTVTGLGFGIVLALLFVLVFILMFFGWIMQKIEAPKTPKAEKAAPSAPKEENAPKEESAPQTESAPSEPAPKPLASPADDTAAIAVALYLASLDSKHDAPTSMIPSQVRETAWNTKSIGLNNIGF